jgi:hypothetical protein
VITASFGDVERSTKQQTPVDYFCFTDNPHLTNDGNWTLIFTPYHQMNLSPVDNGGFLN